MGRLLCYKFHTSAFSEARRTKTGGEGCSCCLGLPWVASFSWIHLSPGSCPRKRPSALGRKDGCTLTKPNDQFMKWQWAIWQQEHQALPALTLDSVGTSMESSWSLEGRLVGEELEPDFTLGSSKKSLMPHLQDRATLAPRWVEWFLGPELLLDLNGHSIYPDTPHSFLPWLTRPSFSWTGFFFLSFIYF